MKSSLFLFFLFLSVLPALSQTPAKVILDLDLKWEKALLESDADFLERLLAEEFVWVHDHASLVDDRNAVIERAKSIQNGQPNTTKNRTSRDQNIIICGQTAVVSGFTLVDRGPSPTLYHFMRTYTWVDDEVKLLANHTMAIPKE